MPMSFSNNKNKLHHFSKKPVTERYEQESDIRSDVLGSYTGVPDDEEYEIPVQDADDL